MDREHVGDVTLRDGVLEVGGVRSPLLDGGAAHAEEAVVFVHGNPGSRGDWADLLPLVARVGRAVAFDLPGFGQADKPRDFDYSVRGYAAFIAGALDGLGIRRAHLVLHDFGGPFGLAWAAQHPQALGSVTLINTGVFFDYRWHAMARIWRTPVLGELFAAATTRSGMRLLLRQGNPRGLPDAFLDEMWRNLDRGTRAAVLALYRATPARQLQQPASAMRALDPPALVVWGRHDPYTSVELAGRQREAFPRAEVVVLDGSGHWPFADDPEGVARVVVPFLTRQLGRSGKREPDGG